MKRRSGFTLIEMMIVTVIIGILAMIASIPLRQVRERAMLTAVKQSLHQANQAVAMYEAINARLPRVVTDIDQFWKENGGVVICRFTYTAAAANRPAYVRIDARHRGMLKGIQTRYPTWVNRYQEQAMTTCNNVRGGSG